MMKSLSSKSIAMKNNDAPQSWSVISGAWAQAWIQIHVALRLCLTGIRRRWIRYQIRHIEYQLAHIQSQRDNDNIAERVLICRRLMMRAELSDL